MREKFVFKTLSQILIYGFNLVSAYFVILQFEVALIGMLAYSRSLIGLFSLFTSIGFTLIYNQYNSQDNFEEYFSILFLYQIILVAANHIPLYFLLFFMYFNANSSLLLILLLTSTIGCIISPFSTHLSSKMKVFKREVPNLLVSVVESSFKIAIALNISVFSDPLLTLVIVSLFFVIIKMIIIFYVSRGEFKFRKLKPTLMKQFLKDTRPIIFITILSVLYTNFRIVILDISFGHEALAYYNFIDTYILTILLMFSGSIKPLYLSLYSKKFSENKNEEVGKISNLIEKYSSIASLFIIIFVFLNGQILLELFLPNYLPSLIYLYLLILIPFFAGINRPYTMLMIPGKKQKINSTYQTIKLVILIILVIFLVPSKLFSIKFLGLGALGLCVIQIVSWLIDTVTYRYFSKKFFGIHSYKKVLIHIIIALDVFLITFFINVLFLSKVIQSNLLIFLMNTIICSGLYLGELWITKELQKEDIKFFLSLLKIKKYKESFLEEMIH